MSLPWLIQRKEKQINELKDTIKKQDYEINLLKSKILLMETKLRDLENKTIYHHVFKDLEITLNNLKSDNSNLKYDLEEISKSINMLDKDKNKQLLQTDSSLLYYAKLQNKSMCRIAINRDPFSLKYVQNQTFDLICLALDKNKNTFINIKKNTLTKQELEYIKLKYELQLSDDYLK